MIARLRPRFRCVAPAYIGFGRSDKWTDVGAYSAAAHSAVVERFVEHLDLRGITLVVQDWGGPGAAERRETREALRRWDKPALLCWSAWIRGSRPRRGGPWRASSRARASR
jgi:pimeloyl-ACP methyl ester carboxylesterase